MMAKLPLLITLITAVFGILGSSMETILAAIIFAVLYAAAAFFPLKQEETRVVVSAVFGFPLVLAAGNAVSAGIVTALLLVSLLAAGASLTKKTTVCSVIAGIAAFLCAMQSSAILAIVIAVVLTLVAVYLLFIAEYRLRKQLMENPHENQ